MNKDETNKTNKTNTTVTTVTIIIIITTLMNIKITTAKDLTIEPIINKIENNTNTSPILIIKNLEHETGTTDKIKTTYYYKIKLNNKTIKNETGTKTINSYSKIGSINTNKNWSGTITICANITAENDTNEENNKGCWDYALNQEIIKQNNTEKNNTTENNTTENNNVENNTEQETTNTTNKEPEKNCEELIITTEQEIINLGETINYWFNEEEGDEVSYWIEKQGKEVKRKTTTTTNTKKRYTPKEPGGYIIKAERKRKGCYSEKTEKAIIVTGKEEKELTIKDYDQTITPGEEYEITITPKEETTTIKIFNDKETIIEQTITTKETTNEITIKQKITPKQWLEGKYWLQVTSGKESIIKETTLKNTQETEQEKTIKSLWVLDKNYKEKIILYATIQGKEREGTICTNKGIKKINLTQGTNKITITPQPGKNNVYLLTNGSYQEKEFYLKNTQETEQGQATTKTPEKTTPNQPAEEQEETAKILEKTTTHAIKEETTPNNTKKLMIIITILITTITIRTALKNPEIKQKITKTLRITKD